MRLQIQSSPQEYEPKITPSSHSSTLRRNNELKNQLIHKNPQQIGNHHPQQQLPQQQQQPPIYESIASKPPLDYRHLDSNINNSNHSQLYQQENDLSSRALAHNQIQASHIDFRQKPNGTNMNKEYRLSSGSDTIPINNTDFVNLSNSSIANQLLSSTNGSGVGFISSTLPRGNASHHNNKDSNRNHHNTNRNHIITDTLPGPESCV